jgi:hypothetical protein
MSLVTCHWSLAATLRRVTPPATRGNVRPGQLRRVTSVK